MTDPQATGERFLAFVSYRHVEFVALIPTPLPRM